MENPIPILGLIFVPKLRSQSQTYPGWAQHVEEREWREGKRREGEGKERGGDAREKREEEEVTRERASAGRTGRKKSRHVGRQAGSTNVRHHQISTAKIRPFKNGRSSWPEIVFIKKIFY